MARSRVSVRCAAGGLAVLLTCAITAPAFGAAFVGTEVLYSRGAFGSDVTSELTTFNLTLGAVAQRFDVGLAVPYLWASDDAGGSEAGPGDVLARIGVLALPETSTGTSVGSAVTIKFPSGDESAGLSSGEYDYGFLVDLGQRFGRAKAVFSAGYLFVGDTPTTDYQDVISASMSCYYRLDRGTVYLSAAGRTASLDTYDDGAELTLGGFYFFGSVYSVALSAFAGLTDGSPDYGVNVGIYRWF